MDRETRLGILAAAILEGTPINWAEAEAHSDPGDQALLRELRIVAEIAALHKQSDSSASAAATQTVAPEPTAAIEWGHLRLFECVGRGSYGEVYRAWDTQLDREVALKLLRASPVAHDPSASLSDPARVVHEGRLLARVRHPHVITVYGAESRAGRVGIWMEFIRGRTLHQIVEQQGPLGAREAVAVGTDVCRALAAVHAAGLVHRDVTARNVMREEGGRVVLMDFGAGHESQTDSSHVAGTPLYMAPEVIARTGVDQRSDIYSLGVLLYHLVSGRYPVTGNSLAAIREAHRLGERTRLRNVRPDLPAAFVQAVETAIEPHVAARCQTAGDLEAALEQSMLSRPTSTYETGRRKWVAPIALAVVGIGAIVGAVAVTKPWSVGSASPDGGASASATASVIARRVQPPAGVSVFSNPSDDGRYAAGMANSTGDAAIVDLVRGEYRSLGMGRGDFSDGYASLGTLSADGTQIAVDWYSDEGHALRVISADGRNHRALIEKAVDVYPYQWSRDGSLILAGVERTGGDKTIALVAAVDGAVRPIQSLGNDWPESMSLSPDGRYIAYDAPEASGAIDRDIFIVDAHTGAHSPLVMSPGHDAYPLWSPDGRAIVFFSDRNRSFSAWGLSMANGRAAGEPQLLKHDVGRVWPRGFTGDGALHYQLASGFAEVFIADLVGTTVAAKPQVVSPRRALSNFYPMWSPDGRSIAFTSERRVDTPRELWVYDTVSDREEPVTSAVKLDRPFGWSRDGSRILAPAASGGQQLFVVHRQTGRTQLIGQHLGLAAWLPSGITYMTPQKGIVLYDPDAQRVIAQWSFRDPVYDGVGFALDGRSALALTKDDRLILRDIERDVAREWNDPGTATLGNHMMAPHTAAVAYVSNRPGAQGNELVLKVWPGSGLPRELLVLRGRERMLFAGWAADGHHLLVLRYTAPPPGIQSGTRPTKLWFVPASGAPPVFSGLEMEALRDISLSPDGRRIAFNSGFKRGEHWVMENLLPR